MNYDAIKTAIANAISDIEDATEGKLQVVLDNWPKDADTELTRLMQFERDARECLESGYAVLSPTWRNEDGTRPMVRIVDNEKALKVLGKPQE